MALLPTLSQALRLNLPLCITLAAQFSHTQLSHAQSTLHCNEQARSALELSYCAIKQAGGGRSLPPLNQFRNNSEPVQRLLLSRDAKRYGIELPTTESKPTTNKLLTPASTATTPQRQQNQNSKQSSTVDSKLSNHSTSQASVPALPDRTDITAPEAIKALDDAVNTNTLFEHCQLEQANIHCRGVLYTHQHNQPLSALAPEVFSDANTLQLPLKQDTDFAEASDLRYLSHIYPLYIDRMLKLGLADSTMSLTKFAHVFKQSHTEDTTKKQDQIFIERFAFIYEQLKKERRQNGIRGRYKQNYPEDIQQCMQLSVNIISCDNVKQNWIYLKHTLATKDNAKNK